MIKDKKIMTQEEHDAFMKEMGITEEEHERWHKEHEQDPSLWKQKAKKSRSRIR